MAKNKCCGTCGCPRMADEPSPKNTSSEGEEARPNYKVVPKPKEPISFEELERRLEQASFQRAQRANRTGRKY